MYVCQQKCAYKRRHPRYIFPRKKYFGDGIYVKSDAHHCGWDFISFEDLECSEDMFNMQLELYSISKGNYDSHDYEGLTVAEILLRVGKDGYCYEMSGVDGLK